MPPSSEISIRPAAPSDAAALGRLGALLVAVHHDFDRARFIPAGPGTGGAYASFLVGELKNPDALVLVAEASGEVAGYVYAAMEGSDWLTLRGPAGVIYDLAVAPERRRGGVGRRLMQAAMAELVARGAPQLVLWAAERNPTAQQIFAKLGFRPTMIEMTWEPPTGA